MYIEPSDKVLTLPNLISLIRLLLVPVFFVLFVIYQDNLFATLVFAIAACTDFIDGQVARRTNSVSKFGQKLDPAIDRVLILSGAIALCLVGRVPLWVLLILLARDICMGLINLYLRWRKNAAFEVILIGKCTAACEMLTFAVLMLLWSWQPIPGAGIVDSSLLPGFGTAPTSIGIWLAYLSVILSLVSGVIYFIRALRLPIAPASPVLPAKQVMQEEQ